MKTPQSQSQSATMVRRTSSASPEQRMEMIQVAAYYRAERRAFDSSPLDDWLEAEAEIDRLFLADSGKRPGAKQSFQQTLEDQFKEWDAKLAELKKKAPALKGKFRPEFDKQLETLAEKRSVANEKLQELRKHTEEAWEDLKEGAEQAWADMRSAMERIVARFK